ncbi:MAG: tRNA-specific adenosine deaminase [Cyanobacteria bacterium PR.3.49]|jgi:tRNA(adenine34) deaminase|nr:tRNA-specific adenosine deaminase [Cyanobacteria bacterium PR.3.49]
MPESQQNREIYLYMEQALQLARQSEEDVPVGAVIVHDGSVIATGVNERERNLDPAGHAEIVAMRKAAQILKNWRLTGCRLYVTLEPCAMCAEAIIQARVSTIVYGAYDPRSGACGSAYNLFVAGRPYPMPEVIGGIMEAECKELLTEFFRSRD